MDRACRETAGQVLHHDGRPAAAFYFSTCGGRTADQVQHREQGEAQEGADGARRQRRVAEARHPDHVAAGRQACDDCMDCFEVCPEHQVIKPALKGAPDGIGPLIDSGNCTNCGRCIDVCARDVFRFTTRLANQATPRGREHQEVTP